LGPVVHGHLRPSTLGSFLLSFEFGHARQFDAVAARLVAGLAGPPNAAERRSAAHAGRSTGGRCDPAARGLGQLGPRAVFDEQLRQWINDAEVAEVPFSAFVARDKKRAVTARLIARGRVTVTPTTSS
jgi:hypothetical protein